MRKWLTVAAVAAVAMLALAASASADVMRYQTATLTADVMSGAYVHTYAITTCGTAFMGTGGITSLNLTESVSGTLIATTIDFDSSYVAGYNVGYTWSANGPLGDTLTGSGGFPVVFTVAGMTDFKNHGEFVSGGGDPHSLVGMPCH